MKNRREYKVVLLNKKTLVAKATVYGKSFGDKESRLQYADLECAVRLLESKSPHALLDGLVRVDIFL